MKKIRTAEFLEALKIAEKAVFRERHQRLSAIGLTAAQAQILNILQHKGPLSLNDLNEELPTDVPPSRVVSTLVDSKLVTRRDQVRDRRLVELGISAQGKKKYEQVRRIDQAVNRWAARRLVGMPTLSAHKVLTALGGQL